MTRRNPSRTTPPPPSDGGLTITDLQPAPYNPRQITPSAAAALSQSLSQFGDIAGITYNRRTGRLVTGHQRVDALRSTYGDGLRLSTSGQEPGIAVLETPSGDHYIVRIVDWDEATEKAANIAANSPYLSANFDDAGLHALLTELEASAPALMSDLRLDELLADVSPASSVTTVVATDEFSNEGRASVTYSGPEERINEIKRIVSEKRNAIAEATARAPRDVPATEALHAILTEQSDASRRRRR